MISAVHWVPAGGQSRTPQKHVLSAAEVAMMKEMNEAEQG